MIKILHIEDDLLDHQLTKAKLAEQNNDFEILLAQTVPEAMELLENNSFQCILSDYHFPQMNGIELLRAIKEKGYEYPFIFFTGQGNEKVAAEALREGADDYFTKELHFAIYERLSRSILRVTKAFEDRNKRLEAEKDLETLFNLSLDIFCVADFNGNFKVFSPAVKRILGWSVDAMLSKPWLEIVHPEDQNDTQEFLQKLKKGEQIVLFENRNICKSGEYKWISWNATPDIASGRFYATARDITDKRRILATLQAERDKAQNYLNIAGSIIVVLNKDGAVSLINKKGCEVLGFNEDEIVGKNWFENYIPEQIRGTVIEAFNRNLAGDLDPIEHFENMVVNSSGQHRLVAWHNNYFKDETGQIIGTISSGEDITEHRKSEEALRESESKLRAMFNNFYQFTGLLTPDGVLTAANETSLKFIGKSEDEVLGKKYWDTPWWNQSPELQQTLIDSINKARKGDLVQFESAHLNVEGEEHIIDFSLKPIMDDSGRIINLLPEGRDITEKKKAERALKISEEKFFKAFHSSPQMIVLSKYESGEVLEVNEAFLKGFGYERKEIIGKTSEILNLVEKSHQEKALKLCSEKGRIRNFEAPFFMKSGNIGIGSFSGEMIEIEGDKCLLQVINDVTEIKKAEEELRIKAQIIDQIHESVVTTDMNSYVISWNNGAERQFGYTEEEALGRHISFIYPEEDHEFLENKVIKPLHKKGSHESELRILKKSGEILYAQLMLSMLRDENNAPIGMIGYSIDLTERIKAQNALKESEENYKTLFEHSPTPMQEQDWSTGLTLLDELRKNGVEDFEAFLKENPESRKMFVGNISILRSNEAYLELYGARDDEFVRNNIVDILPEEGKSIVYETISAVLAGKHTFQTESINRTFRGETIDVDTKWSVVPGHEKNYSKVLMSIIDITERKKAERGLKKSEERFKSLYRNTPVILQTSDPDGRLTEVSNLLLEKFGYKREEVIGSFIFDYLTEQSRSYYLETIREKLFLEGFVLDVPIEAITKGGEIIYALLSAFVEKDENGNPLRSLSVIVDITEKKKMEEEAEIKQRQLIQADKMASLGILVSGVAHEINNPNNYILLGAQALADAWKSAEPILDMHYEQEGEFFLGGLAYSKMRDKLSKLTSGVINSAIRIKDLVKSLKDFARQDSSDLNNDVDVNKALANAVTLIENKLKKSTNTFNIEYDKALPLVKGNQNRIEQVIINLLQNSCDALTANSQAITVTTYFDSENSYAVVEVKDEGRGIQAEMLKHVLDPFFTTKRDTGGTGLGLSVSAGIIKDHGGNLEISSIPGKSTIAMIQLPVNK